METRKLDLASMDREYYSAAGRPEVVVFGDLRYLTIDGSGEPGGINYQHFIEVLFNLAYQVKNSLRKEGNDFSVPKLECLWWVDDNQTFDNTPPDKWHWKLMLRIPSFVSREEVEDAKYEVVDKKGMTNVRKVKIQSLSEGKCVQMMHKGPYERVGETYDRMIEYMRKNSLENNGFYHEIYLSDPGRTAPEKLKTIIRQPVR